MTPEYYRTPAGVWAPGGLAEPDTEDDRIVYYLATGYSSPTVYGVID